MPRNGGVGCRAMVHAWFYRGSYLRSSEIFSYEKICYALEVRLYKKILPRNERGAGLRFMRCFKGVGWECFFVTSFGFFDPRALKIFVPRRVYLVRFAIFQPRDEALIAPVCVAWQRAWWRHVVPTSSPPWFEPVNVPASCVGDKQEGFSQRPPFDDGKRRRQHTPTPRRAPSRGPGCWARKRAGKRVFVCAPYAHCHWRD